jgi:predicted dehydrogenase
MRDKKPLKIAIIGAGSRGWLFARIIRELPHLAMVAAVAEPRTDSREAFAQEFHLDKAVVFDNWEDFVNAPKVCDAVIVATMDRDHRGPAVACMELGYDVLLEKPLAVTLEDCRAIEEAQRRTSRIVGVCHSLRYHKGFQKVKELLQVGRVGRIFALDQVEQVGYWHFAHSFVRGNWSNQDRATFLLMAKCCHDIDFITYLTGKDCLKVASLGELTYFKKENAPDGAPLRCLDGCPAEAGCPYSAPALYLNGLMKKWLPVYAKTNSEDEARAERLRVLSTSPYGRCVYHCDNNVVDHQVCQLLFQDGITATFTVAAFSQKISRKIRILGEKAELVFEEGLGLNNGDRIFLRTFGENNVEEIQVTPEEGSHGGADTHLVQNWLEAITRRDPAMILTSVQESLRTHSIVFAAEKARLESRVIEMAEIYGKH